jgi:curved DNA-binding protein CbpA
MDSASPDDYYEALQISVNAEPETVHRVYRLFAQRFHPDNKETGSESRFAWLPKPTRVLSDPKLRAQYDLAHERQQKERWRLVEHGADAGNDFLSERAVRITVLEVLYHQTPPRAARARHLPDRPGEAHRAGRASTSSSPSGFWCRRSSFNGPTTPSW